MKEKICICGGGNLGTVIAGVAAARGYEVNMLTRSPGHWSQTITVNDPDGKCFSGKLNRVSAAPEDVVPGAGLVLVCLPATAMSEELRRIKPFLDEGAAVGSVFCCTGFFVMALRELGVDAALFGFQRPPFIARVNRYGESASLLGYRKVMRIGFWGMDAERVSAVSSILEDIHATPVDALRHPLQATLTNSNPILHTSRLYDMFSGGEGAMDLIPKFYEEWTDSSSEVLIAADGEFQALLHELRLDDGDIPPLIEYYESHDAASLSRKIRSIGAFKGLLAPMKESAAGGFYPDFESRYFTEDFTYGLLMIKLVGELKGVAMPTIDRMLTWYQAVAGKRYLDGHNIADSDDVRSVGALDKDILEKMISTL